MAPLIAKNRPVKLLFIGDCLAGDTIVSASKGNKPKKMSLHTLYHRFKGYHHNSNPNIPTYLLADMGGYAGQVRMLDMVVSGEKEILNIQAGKLSIDASPDHRFSTSEGWIAARDLRKGMLVKTWRSTRTKEWHTRANGLKPTDKRRVLYSIPYHPYAFTHWVAGRNYKRTHLARAIIEAAMNGLTIEEFTYILRNDPVRAANLQYLATNFEVHHADGNHLNDDLENLEILDANAHLAEHQEEKAQASKGIEYESISLIEERPPTDTYDIMVDPEYQNFIANGFVVHNSGSGKTGALASLADAGYNVRILDLDNGSEILVNLLTSSKSRYSKDAVKRVSVCTLTEPMRPVNGKVIPVKATVWKNLVKMLDHWKDGEEDLGKVSSWGPQDILVIDSLSMAATAAMNFHLEINGRLLTGSQGNEYRRDIGAAQGLVENLLQLLFDDGIKCHVIVNSHIAYVDDPGEAGKNPEDRTQTGYPNALGKALSPKIPRYFNSCLMAKTEGSGSATRHKIFTKSQGMVNLKSSAPLDVAQSYDLSTGLAEYFKALQKGTPE